MKNPLTEENDFWEKLSGLIMLFLELQSTLKYLEENWTDKEIKNLEKELSRTLLLIYKNPYIFRVSHEMKVQKAVVLKFNSLYYRFTDDSIEIISFFFNRQSPNKIKIWYKL